MLLRGCVLLFAAATTAACASARAPRTTQSPEQPGGRPDLLVLLADPGTTTVGHAIVSNPYGQVDLRLARESTRVAVGAAPTPPTVLTEREVQDIFGAALESLPPPPRHFTLFFKFESEELTDDSRLLVQDVLQEVMSRPRPDVVAVGHTDSTGLAAANVQLGLRRANTVQTLLVSAGLAPSSIQVTSHGEAELLVPTADGVFEPRNRRVEITVR